MTRHRHSPLFPRIAAAVLSAAVAGLCVLSAPPPTAVAPETGAGRAGYDSPGEAMEWIMMAQRDENGRIPRDGLMRARAQADVMRRVSLERAERDAVAGVADARAGIERGAWTWIGPTNIGGRVRGLAILPHAPSTLITGGVAGGIWKSQDAGASWRVIDDFMANLAISTIVYRPGESWRLFAGTGEGFFNADSIRGAGIFTSTDEGEHWAQLPSTVNVNFDYVNRLAFSADGNLLLAATREGMFRSTDLGATWTQTLVQTSMMDVKFLAGSSTQVVASGRNRNAYYSTNGGLTWTAAGGLTLTGTARVELGVATSSPHIVFASVDTSSGQIWKSVDGGVTYQLISTPAHLSSQGWYDNAIWVDPTNPDLVMAGGVSVWRSTNGGTSFSTVPNCHVDQHIIAHDPGYNGTTNRRVYIGSDGGVCRMNDVTVNAVTSLRPGLGITQFYAGGGHAPTGRVIGGTQDNGTLTYFTDSGTGVWSAHHGADGGFSAIDPTNPNIMYGEIQNFRIYRTLTGGPPNQYIYGGTGGQSCSKPVPYQITDVCNAIGNFIAPFMLDPNEPNRLLAGGRSLWRTNDATTPNTTTTGPMWEAIKGPTTGNSNISALAVALGHADVVWAGHNNGDVYVTFNGTFGAPTWNKVDAALPNRTVTSIAIDPTDVSIAYVSFGGFSADNVWRTTNSGATWTPLVGFGDASLPSAPVRGVTLHPNVPSWIYAATDVGIFASDDGGATWSAPHQGPANVSVFQLFWMGTTLVAVTHGRGMFTFQASTDFPAFARRPRSQGIISGHIVTFEALAVGAQPIAYQWYRGESGDTSQPIAGAVATHYTTPPTTATTRYWVRATNSFGSVDSPTATLTLLPWGSLLPPRTDQGEGVGSGDSGSAGSSGSSGASGSTAGAAGSTTGAAGSTTGAAGSTAGASVFAGAGAAGSTAGAAGVAGTGAGRLGLGASSAVPAVSGPSFQASGVAVGYGAVPMAAAATSASGPRVFVAPASSAVSGTGGIIVDARRFASIDAAAGVPADSPASAPPERGTAAPASRTGPAGSTTAPGTTATLAPKSTGSATAAAPPRAGDRGGRTLTRLSTIVLVAGAVLFVIHRVRRMRR